MFKFSPIIAEEESKYKKKKYSMIQKILQIKFVKRQNTHLMTHFVFSIH